MQVLLVPTALRRLVAAGILRHVDFQSRRAAPRFSSTDTRRRSKSVGDEMPNCQAQRSTVQKNTRFQRLPPLVLPLRVFSQGPLHAREIC